MWKLSLRTHCSEEELLALLDGELSGGAERAARRHLLRCWRCRARAAEIERTLASMSKLFDGEPATPSKEDARRMLQIRCAELERTLVEHRGGAALRARVPHIAVAASLLICAVSLGAWLHIVNHRVVKAPAKSPELRRAPVRAPLSPPALPAAPLAAIPSRPVMLTSPIVMPAPPEPGLDGVEVEAHYALHRIGTCLGEPVEVVRHADGYVLVQGVVESSERRERIIEELKQVPRLRVAVQTVAEAVAQAGAAPAEGDVGPVIRQDASRMDRELRRYLESNLGLTGDSARAAVLRMSQDAVRSADAILAEAWAVRRLARTFRDPAALVAADRQLLFLMVHDHYAALYKRLASHADVLGPILHWLAGEPVQAASDSSHPEEWNTWIESAFPKLERLHELSIALFASGADDLPPADAAAELLRVMAPVERQSKQLEVAVRQPPAAALADRR